ncbi:MAG: IclR family transcriptional regulator [Pseudomonadota bacterium]
MARAEHPVTALVRGLQILETFGRRGYTLTLAEVAQQLKLPKSTAFRLLSTLVSMDYVVQPVKGGPYSLGPAVLGLGFAVLDGLEVVEAAQPHLEALFKQVEGSVNLSVLDAGGTEIMYIARFHRSDVLSLNLNLGRRVPVYSSSAGRVLCANLGDAERQALLRRLTADPVAGPWLAARGMDLKVVWETARRDGYASVDGDYLPELAAFAAPIRGRGDRVEAAVSVAILKRGESIDAFKDRVLPALLACTGRISAVLGGKGAPA